MELALDARNSAYLVLCTSSASSTYKGTQDTSMRKSAYIRDALQPKHSLHQAENLIMMYAAGHAASHALSLCGLLYMHGNLHCRTVGSLLQWRLSCWSITMYLGWSTDSVAPEGPEQQHVPFVVPQQPLKRKNCYFAMMHTHVLKTLALTCTCLTLAVTQPVKAVLASLS